MRAWSFPDLEVFEFLETPTEARQWWQLDVYAQTGFAARIHEPQALVLFDDDGWQVEDFLAPRGTNDFPFFAVGFAMRLDPWDHVRFEVLLDSGLLQPGSSLVSPIEGTALSGRDVGEALSSAAFVREAFAEFYGDSFGLMLGRYRHRIADGFVFDDYVTGAAAWWSLGSLTARAGAQVLARDFDDYDPADLFLTGQLEWEFLPLQTLCVFATHLFDQRGTLSALLASVAAQPGIVQVLQNGTQDAVATQLFFDAVFNPESVSGNLTQLGFSVRSLPFDGMTLDVHGAASFGRSTWDWTLQTDRVDGVDESGRETIGKATRIWIGCRGCGDSRAALAVGYVCRVLVRRQLP